MAGESTTASQADEELMVSSAPRLPPASVVVAVGIGGALGSVARYQLSRAWATGPQGFPWATWTVNVSGALLLGLVATLAIERWPPTRYVRPFAGVGVCGGYTTWSTFMTDTALLAGDGRSSLAAVYVSATLLAGLAATVLGVWAGRMWPTKTRRSP